MSTHYCDNCLGVSPELCFNYDGPAADASGTDLRTQIANLVPLSMLDGRDRRANVFEVADEIIAILPEPQLPPRDEIARAIYFADGRMAGSDWSLVHDTVKDRYRRLADAAVQPIKEGAAHG